jgi:hypothetical protein
MKKLLLLLMLVPLAFAAPMPWETTAALAVGVSVTLLTIVYIIGTGFGINELQMMAKEEFFQLIAMALMLGVFVGANSLIDAISSNQAWCATGVTSCTLQSAASDSLTASLALMKTTFDDIAKLDMDSSIAASQASQCTVMGVGYSMSACGGFSLLATPLSMAGGIAGFAMGELSAMKKLIEISTNYSLMILLPLGIILRTFKLTRGAGGLLIALGISMHIMLPAGVIFNDMLAATFTNPCPGASQAQCRALTSGYTAALPTPPAVTCDAADINSGQDEAVTAYTTLSNSIPNYLYVILVLATLGPVISLLMFAASLRALTSLGGAEVDVSVISRFI